MEWHLVGYPSTIQERIRAGGHSTSFAICPPSLPERSIRPEDLTRGSVFLGGGQPYPFRGAGFLMNLCPSKLTTITTIINVAGSQARVLLTATLPSIKR